MLFPQCLLKVKNFRRLTKLKYCNYCTLATLAQMSVEVVKCIVSVLLNCFNQFDRDIKYYHIEYIICTPRQYCKVDIVLTNEDNIYQ